MFSYERSLFNQVQNSLDNSEDDDTPVSQDEGTTESRSSNNRESRAASRGTIPIWRLGDSHLSTMEHDFFGPDLIFNDDLRHPIEYVREFLTENLLQTIVA